MGCAGNPLTPQKNLDPSVFCLIEQKIFQNKQVNKGSYPSREGALSYPNPYSYQLCVF